VLAPASSVSGRVLDPAGEPVVGAKVEPQATGNERLLRMRGDQHGPSTTSGPDGVFLLAGLGGGSNTIYATMTGYAASEPQALETRPGERVEGVVLKLRKGATVTGEVYGKDGKLAPGLRIIGQNAVAMQIEQQTSDAQGAFRFENLVPGSWTITALLNDTQVNTSGDSSDATASMMENLKFEMVQLADGDEKHVVLGAPPKDPVAVHGQVKHGKEAVDHGMVTFLAEGSKGLAGFKLASLGADGRYETRLDKPGRYLVSVQVTGAGGPMQQQNVEFRETIPEAKDHQLDLQLPLGGVRGTVHGPDKNPLANTRVTLATDGGIQVGTLLGGHYSEATTDEGGHYAFDYLHPGSYSVAAGGALFGGAFGTASSAGRIVRSGLHVDEGRTLEGVDFDLEAPGDIAGRVVDRAGAAVQDASIFVRDSNGHLLDRMSMIVSAADGSFQYTGVAPGEYQVSARGKGLASGDSAPVHVRSGEKASAELVLDAGTKLEVEVVDDDEKPVDAQLTVVDSRGRDMQGMFGWTELASGLSEGFANSHQVIGPLSPGAYTVSAVAQDGRKASKSVNLDGQPERKLKLRVR